MYEAETHFDPFGDVLILEQHRCTVCAECTTSMEIGDVGEVETCFSLFGDSINLDTR
jgi:hypothetical protein